MSEIKTVPKIKINLLYNNYDVTQDFSKYVTGVTYRDFEDNESDELTITLKDPHKLFQNNWYPEKGAKITCSVSKENSFEVLNCGTFTIDEIQSEFSKNGDIVTIKALAASTTLPLRTINSTYFEKSTLYSIAQKFCNKYGLELANIIAEVAVNILEDSFPRINQFLETDLEFLKRIAYTYGYTFKITDNLLTFIKPITSFVTLFTITRDGVKSLSIRDKSVKKYKACKVSYYNPVTKKNEVCEVTRDFGYDILKLRKKFTSKEEGERIATAYLNDVAKEVVGQIELKEANPYFIAGVNFRLSGFGRLDGAYKIKSTIHYVSSKGWRVLGQIEEIK